jgi:chaperonin GroEL
MSREYDDSQTLQQKIMAGANKLTDNVASTLGPRGRNVLLQEKGRTPFITKDGVTVAAFVALDDPFENAAVQIIKQAAIETNNAAGDGTTTSTVLARAILRESQKHIAAGYCPVELQRGIIQSVQVIVDNLKEMTIPVTNARDIEHIAAISANNDPSIGKLIAMAVDRVGQDGSITIEESRSLETSLDIMEGFRFNAGYSAGAFVTDERRAIMHHDEPLILVTDNKLSSVDQILPVLELVAREGRPLVVIAEDIEGQALAAMIMNAIRGTLKIAAIKAPRYGEERRSILADLALSTGATFITRQSGVKLSEIKMADLGSATFIESDKTHTTIVGGNTDIEEIGNKIESLKQLIVQTPSIDQCTAIQERIARLASGVAVIRVGGATEVEMTEKKHRIEDALEAVKSALEEGIVIGGGCALLQASQSMMLCTEGDMVPPEIGIAAVIVKSACREPIAQMALNAGESPDLIIEAVLSAKTADGKNYGWNFRRGGVRDLIKDGVIDPVKVTRAAIQNAASCAGTLITTNFGIIQTE